MSARICLAPWTVARATLWAVRVVTWATLSADVSLPPAVKGSSAARRGGAQRRVKGRRTVARRPKADHRMSVRTRCVVDPFVAARAIEHYAPADGLNMARRRISQAAFDRGFSRHYVQSGPHSRTGALSGLRVTLAVHWRISFADATSSVSTSTLSGCSAYRPPTYPCALRRVRAARCFRACPGI